MKQKLKTHWAIMLEDGTETTLCGAGWGFLRYGFRKPRLTITDSRVTCKHCLTILRNSREAREAR